MPPKGAPALGTALGLAIALTSAGGTWGCGRGGVSGGAPELLVLSPSLPERLDPTADARLGCRSVFFNVFEPLVRVDSSGQIVPGVAESWWNPSPDVYVFRLREGVRFHDGSAFAASDVMASVARARAPQSLIAGNLADVVEVRIEGPRAVAFRTRVPTALLLHALTAVPITKLAGPAGPWLGTGPYEVADFEPGVRVTLKRFAGYHGKPPEVATVAFQRFQAEDELLAALKSSQPVVVLDPKAAVALARRDPRHRVAADLSGSLVYLAFDVGRSPTPGVGLPANPFCDVRVRRAIRLALDLDGLIARGPSSGRPATQLAPPGVFGFDPGLALQARDLAGAKALLREVGLGEGFQATLDVRQHDRPLADAVASQLGVLGIRVAVNALPGEEFVRRIESGSSSLYAYGWVLGQETGEALKNFFHSKDPARALGLNNRTGYANPQVDRAIEEAMEKLERGARLSALYRVMRLLMEDLPWVPLYVAEATRLYPSDLSVPPRLDGMLVLREARRQRP